MLNNLFVVLGLVLAQPANTSNVQANKTAYFPPNLFLVRARTVAVKTAPRQYPIGTFVITHVFAGSPSLKEKSFECAVSSPAMFSGISIEAANIKYRHVTILEENVEGLWWVHIDKAKELRPELRGEVVDAYRIRRFPITNGKLGTIVDLRQHDRAAEWKEGLAWAESIETVYRARSDIEREAILKRLAMGERSASSPWAINLLGRVNPKGTVDFLRKLAANDKLSSESHVVMDTILSRLDPKWDSSGHWERMLSRWLESPDLVYYNSGMERLWEAGRNNEIDFAHYAKILGTVLARADKLNDGQERWLGIVLESPATFSGRNRELAFDWFAGYVRNGKTAFVRSRAAAGLRIFGRLNPAQLNLVKTLRSQSNETQVQQALDVVLRSH